MRLLQLPVPAVPSSQQCVTPPMNNLSRTLSGTLQANPMISFPWNPSNGFTATSERPSCAAGGKDKDGPHNSRRCFQNTDNSTPHHSSVEVTTTVTLICTSAFSGL